ncbi:MAG: hypothetical protein KGJ90_05000 [Patescibacteria group bacterium]|nr:hypothetical protein [Patescibacteria group bacterium]
MKGTTMQQQPKHHESLIHEWLENNEREYLRRKNAPLTEGQVIGEVFATIFNTIAKEK